jgi:hypothetical protein
MNSEYQIDLRFLLLFFVSLAICGCGRKANEHRMVDSMPIVSHQQKLKIQGLTGLVLPDDAKVLSESDGGSQNGEYYEWVLFAPNGFNLPQMNRLQGGYVKMSIDTVRAAMVVSLGAGGESELSDALSAFVTEWTQKGTTLRASVLHMQRGDYLRLEKHSHSP